MSDTGVREKGHVTRRDFMQAAAAVTGFCLLDCEVAAQQVNAPFSDALHDAGVVHGVVTFPSGAEVIDGYMSRPEAKGRYPIVLVITGNAVSEEYIRNTTALLAQAGFVGLAPNIFSLQLEGMSVDEKREIFANRITDERIFRDLQAGIDYLAPQPFVQKGPGGAMGFCFGGRCALMFASRARHVGAVVPFYGNLKTPAFAKRLVDPIDVAKEIRAPIQGHYAIDDAEIPREQLEKFEHEVRAQGTPVRIFTYEAKHGFFAYTRASYQANAAKTAWERTRRFLQEHLRS